MKFSFISNLSIGPLVRYFHLSSPLNEILINPISSRRINSSEKNINSWKTQGILYENLFSKLLELKHATISHIPTKIFSFIKIPIGTKPKLAYPTVSFSPFGKQKKPQVFASAVSTCPMGTSSSKTEARALLDSTPVHSIVVIAIYFYLAIIVITRPSSSTN